MLSTLALTAALGLAPAQGGDLSLKNPRVTYGILGQERKESKILIGDVFTLSFDIDGLKARDDGQILYSIGMELLDSAKKSQFKQDPKELEAVNSLGGGRMPAFALVEIRTDTKPGDYILRVTVTDRIAKVTKDLEYKFVVAEPQLGFAQVSLTYPGYIPAPPLAVPGQTLWVNFAAVGFELDTKNKQPQIDVEMRVTDLDTKMPTLAKPATGGAREVAEEFKKLLPFQFPLQLNRAGRFRIELKVTDQLTKKTATQTLDFTVQEPK